MLGAAVLHHAGGAGWGCSGKTESREPGRILGGDHWDVRDARCLAELGLQARRLVARQPRLAGAD
jgi:hypothetical protein